MNMSIEHVTVDLPRRRTLELCDAAGVRVADLSGSVWITLDGDTRDVVLGPGQSFDIDRGGVALVHATADARLEIMHGEGKPEMRGRVRRWLAERARLHYGPLLRIPAGMPG